MISGNSFLFPLILGFIYYMLRLKVLRVDRADEKTLLIKLSLLGTTETEEPKVYKGIFVKSVSEDLNKIKIFSK